MKDHMYALDAAATPDAISTLTSTRETILRLRIGKHNNSRWLPAENEVKYCIKNKKECHPDITTKVTYINSLRHLISGTGVQEEEVLLCGIHIVMRAVWPVAKACANHSCMNNKNAKGGGQKKVGGWLLLP